MAPEVAPRPDEAVADKITMSALEGTFLDIALRDCGINAFAIIGVAMEIGIEPTVRHATDLGYIPVVIADACGAGHAEAADRSLDGLRFTGDALITDVETFCALLGKKTIPQIPLETPMKAIRVHEFGEPSVMKLEDVPDPLPKAGEVVVKVAAVGVNPVDAYIRAGGYGPRLFPFTPGSDAAGTVETVGMTFRTSNPATGSTWPARSAGRMPRRLSARPRRCIRCRNT